MVEVDCGNDEEAHLLREAGALPFEDEGLVVLTLAGALIATAALVVVLLEALLGPERASEGAGIIEDDESLTLHSDVMSLAFLPG